MSSSLKREISGCVFFIVFSFVSLALAGTGARVRSEYQTRNNVGSRTNGTKDAQWSEILDLAAEKDPASRARLEAFSREAETNVIRSLASRMLENWREDLHTYILEHPIALSQACLDPDELKRLLPGKSEATAAILQVDVDDRGTVTDVEVLKPPKYPQLVDPMVRHLRETLFCPARTAEGYVPATVTIVCSTEVY